MIRFAKQHSERGFTFKSGVLDWRNMSLLSVTEASFANYIGENGEPMRSQGGIGENGELMRSQGGILIALGR